MANPRTPATESQRILRRGFNYHRGFDAAGQLDQGLVFVAFNQDIARQFATIQQRCREVRKLRGVFEAFEDVGDAVEVDTRALVGVVRDVGDAGALDGARDAALPQAAPEECPVSAVPHVARKRSHRPAPTGSSTTGPNQAVEDSKITPSTRSGYVAANIRAIGPPSDVPIT